MRRIIPLIAAALAVASCGPLAAVTAIAPISSAGDKVVLEGTRALILAHNAYQAAAEAGVLAVKSGKLSPAQLDALSKANDRALALLGDASSGISAADKAAGIFAAVNDMNKAMGR